LRFTPHTDKDVSRALSEIGVESLDELFSDVPAELADPAIDLEDGLDERTLLQRLGSLARANDLASPVFLGGGVYRHFTPAVVRHLAFRSEFYTAYTPYQAELSQGTLQSIFEYQSMICALTGLEVSNASMYDGATAAAEAALMATRILQSRGKAARRAADAPGPDRLCVSLGVDPQTRAVIATYAEAVGMEVVTLPLQDGRTPATLGDAGAAALLFQSPNFLGLIEDGRGLTQAAHTAGALAIAAVNPVSLALLETPGEYGADIAVGEGQPLGNPMGYGGPHFGFFAARSEYVRQMPGRIAGETVDAEGRRGYALTFQTREQHIRREKATSNICSNHAFNALIATIHLSALGPEGLRQVAEESVRAAWATREELSRIPGVTTPHAGPFFNEFVIQTPVEAGALRRELGARGVRAGVPVPLEYGLGEGAVLIAATEMTTRKDLTALSEALSGVLQGVR
jgi:glycine dehydrogenase subunit 1